MACGQPSRWTKEAVPAISSQLADLVRGRAAMASASWAPSDQPHKVVPGSGGRRCRRRPHVEIAISGAAP
jgi:hypothetical protein